VSGLAAIGIVTRNMEEAVRFYRLLGVDVPDPGGDHIEARLPNGLRLMWDPVDQIREMDSHWVEPQGYRMALGFECASPAEVDKLYKRITGAGYESKKEPWDAFWGQRYAQVIDPDGNVVDLFAQLPRPTT
jgi:uncharacterized glyoxalase superfamily protein PhnB